MKQTNLDYYDVETSIEDGYPFMVIIAGRGTGKTYSCLDYCHKQYVKTGDKFIYMRRTSEEAKLVCNEKTGTNPYLTLNRDKGYDVEVKTSGRLSLLHEDDNTIGYVAAMSTFHNIRGMDFSDVGTIFYDEFMPEITAHPMKGESDALFNMYETVNRNRELDGEKPVKLILCGNANNLGAAVIRGMHLADDIRQMIINDERERKYPDRCLKIILPTTPELAEAKAETALYRLTRGTRYMDMAINNNFTDDDFGTVRHVDYRQFLPKCRYGDMYFYISKMNDIVICSRRKANVPMEYEYSNREAFMRDIGYRLSYLYDRGTLYFTDYDLKLDFENI